MTAVERAMRAHGDNRPNHSYSPNVTRPRATYAGGTSRPPQYDAPTGPVDFPYLLRMSALIGVPVARWSDRHGRHLIYRDGIEVPE